MMDKKTKKSLSWMFYYVFIGQALIISSFIFIGNICELDIAEGYMFVLVWLLFALFLFIGFFPLFWEVITKEMIKQLLFWVMLLLASPLTTVVSYYFLMKPILSSL